MVLIPSESDLATRGLEIFEAQTKDVQRGEALAARITDEELERLLGTDKKLRLFVGLGYTMTRQMRGEWPLPWEVEED